MPEKLPLNIQEQQVTHVEESPQETDRPKEGTLAQPPRDLDAEIQEVDAKIKSEMEGLNAAHENLGLPPNADSAAIKGLRAKREKLVTDRDSTKDTGTSPEQNPDAKKNMAEQEVQKRLQNEIQQSGDEIVRFGSMLQKRERDQLSPLMGQSEVSSMMVSTRTIEDSVKLGKIDFEGLGTALRGVNRGLQNYGRYRSSGAIREDTNNLKGLAAFARSAAEELHRMQKTLNQSTEKTAVEAANAAGSLSKTMEAIWMHTSRRLDAVSRYSGR